MSKIISKEKFDGYATELNEWLGEKDAKLVTQFEVKPKGIITKLLYRIVQLEIRSRIVLVKK